MMVMKDMGLVTQVFNDYKLASLIGHLAIGHTRYSTTGSSSWHNAQPMYRQAGGTEFAVGHNGNLTNIEELAASMGMLPGMVTSDSDLVAELVAPAARPRGRASAGRRWSPLEAALLDVLPLLEGAFSLVLADRASLVGVRDPNGFRPLCLGKLDDGWVLASETPALDIVGAHFVREVEPGEVLVISADGCESLRPMAAGTGRSPSSACSSSCTWPGPTADCTARSCTLPACAWASCWPSRRRWPPTWSIGVPDSGMPAAEGYSRRSGVPFGHGLVKNRYIGRTFINPDPRPARSRRAAQAQPAARGHRRQAPGGGGRLDRAGYHDPGHGGHAARSGGQGGPPAHLVTALPVALLLRPGHGRPGPS